MANLCGVSEMEGVPRRDLSLRHSEAKFLLELVGKERRKMTRGWVPDKFFEMMVTNLEERLHKIVNETK